MDRSDARTYPTPSPSTCWWTDAHWLWNARRFKRTSGCCVRNARACKPCSTASPRSRGGSQPDAPHAPVTPTCADRNPSPSRIPPPSCRTATLLTARRGLAVCLLRGRTWRCPPPLTLGASTGRAQCGTRVWWLSKTIRATALIQQADERTFAATAAPTLTLIWTAQGPARRVRTLPSLVLLEGASFGSLKVMDHSGMHGIRGRWFIYS
mmetsp:Transcript_19310/g.36996  ORF Transcript_19310/g.36996 Transcript_19310/m.36996 type:complete len:209 (+) Transcript_19310:899-1525(+)